MKRLLDHSLTVWKTDPYRKPLLLRGARQVGKTHAARILGKSFKQFVEINFESDLRFRTLFDLDLDPERIMRDISLNIKKRIEPGKSLIFFDEIQVVPQALTALRYFYEKLPGQHIIAAGSLLDFATQLVGIPVGRVSSLYMHPMSFLEFLCACGHQMLAQELLKHTTQMPMSRLVHEKLLELLGHYMAIGGMPEAVDRWRTSGDPHAVVTVHHALIDTYRQDFAKYATKFQIKYVERMFNAVPRQLGTKFKYSAVEGDYRKRELAPCLDLLATAGIAHCVYHSASNGVPLGAEADLSDYKVIFLDVGLSQAMLDLDLKAWFLDPQQEFVNKGSLVEALVGQELLAYADPVRKANLFYWRRNAPASQAEVDYVMQGHQRIVPIEVKSGAGTTLRSMHLFLEQHQQSPHGIRFSTQNYSVHEKIHSYPLYAVASVVQACQGLDAKCYEALLQ